MGRPPGSRRAMIEIVGSVGPAGSTRSGLPARGFILTLSALPKGLIGTVPSRISQRRLNRCSGASAVAKATWAGLATFRARRTPSAMRRATNRS